MMSKKAWLDHLKTIGAKPQTIAFWKHVYECETCIAHLADYEDQSKAEPDLAFGGHLCVVGKDLWKRMQPTIN